MVRRLQLRNHRRIAKRDFQMDYIYYMLVVLALLAACLFLVRIPGRTRLSEDHLALAEKALKRRRRAREQDHSQADLLAHRHQVMERELSRVGTPWGWPGHEATHSDGSGTAPMGEEVHGVSESLHRWADRLLREKRTVEDHEYRLRRQSSLRALLEDRYGRAGRMASIEYEKVKAPLLRDPDQPHDQMDNFPSGRGDEITAGLRAQRGVINLRFSKKAAQPDLGKLKTPWGW